jgi:hypothetical protein
MTLTYTSPPQAGVWWSPKHLLPRIKDEQGQAGQWDQMLVQQSMSVHEGSNQEHWGVHQQER